MFAIILLIISLCSSMHITSRRCSVGDRWRGYIDYVIGGAFQCEWRDILGGSGVRELLDSLDVRAWTMACI